MRPWVLPQEPGRGIVLDDAALERSSGDGWRRAEAVW